MNPLNFRSIPLSKVFIVCVAILAALAIIASTRKQPEQGDSYVYSPAHAVPNPSTATASDGTVINVSEWTHTGTLEMDGWSD